MLPRHVSRTDQRGPVASRGGATDVGADDDGDPGVESSVVRRASSAEPMGGSSVGDESERMRLIADIMRLMRDPAIPDNARVAGMTFIGWLARRRPDEAPHALGIEEARESERRIRAARAKAR